MKNLHCNVRKILLGLMTVCVLLIGGASQVFAAGKTNLKDAKVKLSTESFTYNCKVQRPKVTITYNGNGLKEKKNYIVKFSKGCKNVGTYTVQITGKGSYTGTVKKKFTILPPKTQITSSYSGKDNVTVFVKKSTRQISGYQLRYSTNSKLKKAKIITAKGIKTTRITIGNLKSGTAYYIQTRAYKVVKGKKYFSKWSATAVCKTQKKSNDKVSTSKPVPKLIFQQGKAKYTMKSGAYFSLCTSNRIKNITISDSTVVYRAENKGKDYCDFETLEPGKSVITITDIYGQKITSTITVTQELYSSNKTSYEVKSTVIDNTLPIPSVQAIKYQEWWIGLSCSGTQSDSDSYAGYECYISDNEKFEYTIYSKHELVNGDGNTSFDYYLANGCRYYIKVRSYTVRNGVKTVGVWSNTYKADLPNYDVQTTGNAKYSYEIYGLDKQKMDFYTKCIRPVFIKTENTDADSFRVICNGKSVLREVYSGGSPYIYADIPYEKDESDGAFLKKVKGGYIGYMEFDSAGAYNIELREYTLSGYIVAKTVTLNVLDYEQELKTWMQNIIDKTTTANMTSFEKMDAVCAYLTQPGLFKYETVQGEKLVSLASEPNHPCFITYRWNSATSPAALCRFAELIGGFDDIHDCFGDYTHGSYEWSRTHFYAKLTLGSETKYYAVCPMIPTGEVGEIKKIDLTDFKNMRKFG